MTNETTLKALLHITRNNRHTLRDYLKNENDKFSLWRLKYYTNEDIEEEYEEGIEKVREKVKTRLKYQKRYENLLKRTDYDEAQALFEFYNNVIELGKKEVINYYKHYHPEIKYFRHFYDGFNFLNHFQDVLMIKPDDYIAICIESHKKMDLRKAPRLMIEKYLDGKKIAAFVKDTEKDVIYQYPQNYLSQQYRFLSDSQKETIQNTRLHIEKLIETKEKLNLDDPEDESKWEEMDDEIKHLEEKIKYEWENRQGEWDKRKLNEVLHNRLKFIAKHPYHIFISLDKPHYEFVNMEKLAVAFPYIDGVKIYSDKVSNIKTPKGQDYITIVGYNKSYYYQMSDKNQN